MASNHHPGILNLRLQSRPESAATVRTVLTGIAGSVRLPATVLDDLKTTISEACNNAVEHAYRGASGAIAVHLDVQPERVTATVRDWGSGFRHIAPVPESMRTGLPLINALADRAEFASAPGGGTEVSMAFDLPRDPRRAALLDRVSRSEAVEAQEQSGSGLAGEVVVTMLPVELLAGVLSPLTSAFAARSRPSLERFCDVYLVAQAVTQHVVRVATSSRVSFALTGGEHQLELAVGPLRAGASPDLKAIGGAAGPASPPAGPVGELRSEPIGDSELLRVVLMVDHERSLSGL